MPGAVAVGFYRSRITRNPEGRRGTDQAGQPYGLAADEGRVAETFQGSPAGTPLVEIDQSKAARVIPVPAKGMDTVQARGKRQEKKQAQAQQAAPAEQGGWPVPLGDSYVGHGGQYCLPRRRNKSASGFSGYCCGAASRPGPRPLQACLINPQHLTESPLGAK